MNDRETWATRAGFIIAAIGSAVGLGNIWQFPFKTATNGGAVFLVVYLLAVFAIGFPAMLAEFVLGRRTHLNAIGAFEQLGHRQWRFAGALSLLTGFWILSYYSVVGGWVIRYIVGSATGAYFGAPAEYFGAISSGPDAVVLHAVFMFVTVGIVALGVEDGIERATKIMVPSIVVIMIGLAVWAATLGGAGAGYAYFLDPDFSVLIANAGDVIPFAVGQAFFTLSLGMGIMITYSSYISEDDHLPIDGGSIVIVNTLIGVLAGLVVFPILFSIGVDPNTSGPSAIFVAMASAFGQLPYGRVLGVIFFAVVLIAALSSAISLLEVTVSYFVDTWGIGRVKLSAVVGLALFVLGLPSAWKTAWLGWFDTLAYKLLLPTAVLLILLFVGWVLADDALDELRKGAGRLDLFGPFWLWMIRTLVLLGVLITLALGIQTLFFGQNPAIIPPI
ncbi:MAG: sodium-dependent transporter [Halodesulfurarchaeum sp.]